MNSQPDHLLNDLEDLILAAIVDAMYEAQNTQIAAGTQVACVYDRECLGTVISYSEDGNRVTVHTDGGNTTEWPANGIFGVLCMSEKMEAIITTLEDAVTELPDTSPEQQVLPYTKPGFNQFNFDRLL